MKRAVCIGEVLWDRLPQGERLGGAPCNCAMHLRRLGWDTVLVSAVGEDGPGREALSRLSCAGVDTSRVDVDASHSTGYVQVTLDGDGSPSYAIGENVAWDHLSATPAALEAVAGADAVCFGTLAQRAPRSRAAVRDLIRATPSSALVVCDLNLRDPFVDAEVVEASLSMCNVLKLNDGELVRVKRLLGVDGINGLAREYGIDVVALTRGPDGSSIRRGEEESAHAGFDVDVVDTVGAGDAFTAALVHGLAVGDDLDAVSERANRLAARTCTHSGAVPD